MVFKQLLKEFWIPLLGAVLWTLTSWLVGSIDVQGWKKATVGVVGTFAPAFFFLSFLTGQFFRVNKQLKVEGSFTAVEDRLTALVGHLEKQTQDIVGHATGGESYCWVMTSLDGTKSDHLLFMAMHVGDYTLEDIDIRVADLDALKEGSCDLRDDRFFKIDRLLPGTNHVFGGFPLNGRSKRSFNIFMHSKNGRVVQEVRLVRGENGWSQAMRVSRGHETLLESVPDDFPLGSNPWD